MSKKRKMPVEESISTRNDDLSEREEELRAGEEKLQLEREQFDLERSAYSGNASPEDILDLNIGGTKKVSVLRSTLTCVPGSMLAAKFSGRWDDSIAKDKDGAFFLDHDISQFGPILSFLRNRAIPGDQKPILPPSLTELGPNEVKNFYRLVEYYGLMDGMYPAKLQEVFFEDDDHRAEICGLKCSVSGVTGNEPKILVFDAGCHEGRVKAIEVKIWRPTVGFALSWHKRIKNPKNSIELDITEKHVEVAIDLGQLQHDFPTSDFVHDSNSSEGIVLRSEDYGRRWYINGKLVEGRNLFSLYDDEDVIEGKTLQDAIDEFFEKNSSSGSSFSSSSFYYPHFYVRDEGKFEVTHYELTHGL